MFNSTRQLLSRAMVIGSKRIKLLASLIAKPATTVFRPQNTQLPFRISLVLSVSRRPQSTSAFRQDFGSFIWPTSFVPCIFMSCSILILCSVRHLHTK
jgi:hypothetical protein